MLYNIIILDNSSQPLPVVQQPAWSVVLKPALTIHDIAYWQKRTQILAADCNYNDRVTSMVAK